MFSGDEVVRFGRGLSFEKAAFEAESCLESLGAVDIGHRGSFEIRSRRRLDNFLTNTTIDGHLGEKRGEYVLEVNYTVSLSAMGWALFVVGILFFLLGLFVLFAPFSVREKVARRVRHSVREIEFGDPDAIGEPRRDN